MAVAFLAVPARLGRARTHFRLTSDAGGAHGERTVPDPNDANPV